MEKHSRCIRGVCKLCGQARTIVEGPHPIPKESFARQIESAFDIVVGDDSLTVHTPFICKLCEAKLRQWWVKFSKKNIKKATCNIQLASFDQAECDVYSEQQGEVGTTQLWNSLDTTCYHCMLLLQVPRPLRRAMCAKEIGLKILY